MTTLNYIENFLILAYDVTRCVSISVFASLFGIPKEIPSSVVGIKICILTAGIKKYKSIIKKQNKKHDEMVLLVKTNLNNIGVLSSKALIESYISHDEFALGNNVLREYDNLYKEIKSLKTSTAHQRFQYIYKTMLLYCLKCGEKKQIVKPKSCRDK